MPKWFFEKHVKKYGNNIFHHEIKMRALCSKVKKTCFFQRLDGLL